MPRFPFYLALTLALIFSRRAASAGTAFSYQGRLNVTGAPANGSYEFRFTLHDAAMAGTPVGPTRTNSAVAVAQGTFTTAIDFGAGVFTGEARWLEIRVRTNGSAVAFTVLTPRQVLNAVPYALHALNGVPGPQGLKGDQGATGVAGPAGPTGAQGIQGVPGLVGPAGATGAQGAQGPAGSADAWGRLGTAGTTAGVNFLGTTDNQPLEFKANNQRGLRLEYVDAGLFRSVNVIGGHGGNLAGNGVVGATIGGGGYSSPLAAAKFNRVEANFGTVSGGYGNTASGTAATVGGGNVNTASGIAATVPGGFDNRATNYAFAAGSRAKADHPGAFVWADSTAADFASTADNQFLIRAGGGVGIGTSDPAGAALRVAGKIKADSFEGMINSSMLGTTDNQPLELKVNNQRGLRLEYVTDSFGTGVNVIGGNRENSVGNGVLGATIAGGGYSASQLSGFGNINRADADFATVSGGTDNAANGVFATVGGGFENDARGSGATVGGGGGNEANGDYATIPGGRSNAAAEDSFAAGQRAKADHKGAFVWADRTSADFATTADNQFLIRASGGVGIGTSDPAGAALRVAGTVAATSFSGDGSGLTGVALRNDANLFITDQGIRGGSLYLDYASANNGVFEGSPKLVFGGTGSGEGILSKRTDGGNQFGLDFYTAFLPRLSLDNDGNLGVGTRDPKARLHVTGDMKLDGDHTLEFGAEVPGKEANAGKIGYQVFTPDALDIVGAGVQGGAGRKIQFWAETGANFTGPVTATSFANSSDRNLKENFAVVNPREMLDKVTALAISRWNFKRDATTPHVGPMAQDFHAAFGLGTDDKHIATVDADGVALAAIQGLNEKVESENAVLRAGLQTRDERIAGLERSVAELKALVSGLAPAKGSTR